MILKLILLLAFTALLAWVITPSENPKIETIFGNYEYSKIQNITFYPNGTWQHRIPDSFNSGKYSRNGKNVSISGRFIHEDFRILKNKSLRDSVGRVWKKNK